MKKQQPEPKRIMLPEVVVTAKPIKKTINQKLADIDNNKRLNRIAGRKYALVDKKIEKAKNDTVKLQKIDKKYGYDYKTADKYKIKADSSGHMPSIADNGQLLKAKSHPTIKKTIKTEKVLGNKIFKVDGVRYTAPKSEARVYKKELKADKIVNK
jgi:hypothetical protein